MPRFEREPSEYVEKVIAGVGHHRIARGAHRRAGAGGHIQPGMRIAWLAVEEAAQAEA